MKRLAVMLAIASLGACSVGPDFSKPRAQLPDTWQAGAAVPGVVDAQ